MQKQTRNKKVQKKAPALSTDGDLNPLKDKIDALKLRIKKLGDFCNELNPYVEISNEQKMFLMDHNILEFNDPFKITNQLLMLLEDSIEELHKLEPLSNSEQNGNF